MSPRPERVVQLCHPDIRNDFPPLRTSKPVAAEHLPVQLTSFVGRGAEIDDVRQILADNRLVTLTGAGGVGQDPAGHTGRGPDRQPISATECGMSTWRRSPTPTWCRSRWQAPSACADQPGRSTMDTLIAVRRRPSDVGGAGQL